MNFYKKITCVAALMAVFAVNGVSAQEYKLPGQHNAQHGTLIANQDFGTVDAPNTTEYMEMLFNEEEEPEFDIYTEGWDSGSVNCYKDVDVPQTMVIDVSKYSMPHPGYVTSPYGYRRRFRRMHKGIDLKAFTGDTVRAAFDGKIRITKFERRGYGYYVVIRHTNDLETVYGHLSKFLVEPDQIVHAGDPIGLAGNTGRSFGSHLHFETRYMGYAINPAAIFDFPNQTTHTDQYTFDKNTYKEARNYSPSENRTYEAKFRAENKDKYTRAAKSSGGSNSYYTVRSGDSLSKIASRNGTTVRKICSLNGIKSTTTIRPGQRLRIK